MGEKLGISELLARIGDENVTFQALDQAMTNLQYDHKKGTKITFKTDAKSNMDGTVEMGIVVWAPREKVAKVLKEFNDAKTANNQTGENNGQVVEVEGRPT